MLSESTPKFEREETPRQPIDQSRPITAIHQIDFTAAKCIHEKLALPARVPKTPALGPAAQLFFSVRTIEPSASANSRWRINKINQIRPRVYKSFSLVLPLSALYPSPALLAQIGSTSFSLGGPLSPRIQLKFPRRRPSCLVVALH